MPATIDLQAVQTVEHPERGVARAVTDLVRAIEAEHADAVGAYVFNPTLPLPLWLASLARAGRLVSATDLRRRTSSVHLVGSPFEGVGLDAILPPAARLGSVPVAVVLYDLIPLRFADRYLADPVARRRYLARCELVRGADAVLAISEQTARDATDLLGVPARRVHMVGCAPSPDFDRIADPTSARADVARRFPSVATRFVLCPGGSDWRKNLDGLVEAWGRVVASADGDVDLVIAGQLRTRADELVRIADDLGVREHVRLLGLVSDDELRALYQAAEVVVFPSHFEGYGLPVMEARRMGAAVLAGRNSALVELLPDEALFDSEEPGDIAAHLLSALDDPGRLDRLQRAPIPPGHTWPEVAARTAAVLDAVGRHRRRRSRRPQIAVVSPLPPVASGVADHSLRLIDALHEHADVHAFTDQLDLVRLPEGVGLHHLDHLGRAGATRGGFDAVLHCWGNSETHASMLPVMRTWPGIVLAHDVAVAGLYDRCSSMHPDLVDHATFAQLLRREYGDRAVPSTTGAVGYAEADAAGMTMAGPVIDWSERYLTHSEAAAQLARRERPALVDRIAIVPFAFPPAHPPARPEQVGRPPVIATFGIVSLTKRADVVVDAYAEVRRRFPEALLVFVGHVGHGLRMDLQARAERRGIGAGLVFTGRVPRETYEHWLGVTDVAVQLRRSWGGEASAATADALAWGIPTVVSDLGWAAELPDGTVSRVRDDADPEVVAAAVSELLDDKDLRVHRSHASIAHAAAHGFDRLARELLAIIDG